MKENITIGHFILYMAGNVLFKNDSFVELYTRQAGLLITRSRGEARLKESEAQLRNIFDAVGDPLFIIY